MHLLLGALPPSTIMRRRRHAHDARRTTLAFDGPDAKGPEETFAELGCRPPTADRPSLRRVV